MDGSGLTLIWPGLEADRSDYTASLPDSVEPDSGWECCPLCGGKIRFGQHPVPGPNGYLLHKACIEKELAEYAEYAEDTTIEEWLSDSIFEARRARGDKDDCNY